MSKESQSPRHERILDKVEEIPRRMTGLVRDEKDIQRCKGADVLAGGSGAGDKLRQ